MEPNLPAFRHDFTGCPCGHSEHVGHGLEKIDRIDCPECDAIAGVNTLTIVTIETAQTLGLNVGMTVQHGGRKLSIVQIEQVTKLWGRIATEFVRVVMA